MPAIALVSTPLDDVVNIGGAVLVARGATWFDDDDDVDDVDVDVDGGGGLIINMSNHCIQKGGVNDLRCGLR